MGFSRYVDEQLIAHWFTKRSEGLWLGLFGDAGELSGGNYHRVRCANWTSPEPGGVENERLVEWAPSSQVWGKLSAVVAFDAERAGHEICRFAINEGEQASVGNHIQVRMSPGRLRLSR